MTDRGSLWLDNKYFLTILMIIFILGSQLIVARRTYEYTNRMLADMTRQHKILSAEFCGRVKTLAYLIKHQLPIIIGAMDDTSAENIDSKVNDIKEELPLIRNLKFLIILDSKYNILYQTNLLDKDNGNKNPIILTKEDEFYLEKARNEPSQPVIGNLIHDKKNNEWTIPIAISFDQPNWNTKYVYTRMNFTSVKKSFLASASHKSLLRISFSEKNSSPNSAMIFNDIKDNFYSFFLKSIFLYHEEKLPIEFDIPGLGNKAIFIYSWPKLVHYFYQSLMYDIIFLGSILFSIGILFYLHKNRVLFFLVQSRKTAENIAQRYETLTGEQITETSVQSTDERKIDELATTAENLLNKVETFSCLANNRGMVLEALYKQSSSALQITLANSHILSESLSDFIEEMKLTHSIPQNSKLAKFLELIYGDIRNQAEITKSNLEILERSITSTSSSVKNNIGTLDALLFAVEKFSRSQLVITPNNLTNDEMQIFLDVFKESIVNAIEYLLNCRNNENEVVKLSYYKLDNSLCIELFLKTGSSHSKDTLKYLHNAKMYAIVNQGLVITDVQESYQVITLLFVEVYGARPL